MGTKKKKRRRDNHTRVVNAEFKKMMRALRKMQPQHDFEVGDVVKINTDKITKADHYESKLKVYRDFVESSSGMTFEISTIADRLVEFKGKPRWLFYVDDLILVKKRENNTK